MLSSNLQRLLSAQIGTELGAASAYRQAAAVVRRSGMAASHAWLAKAAAEEREHSDKFATYLEHRGAFGEMPAVDAPPPMTTPLAVAELVMALEESVTAKLKAIREAAEAEGDALTCVFLLPILEEQIHGEDDARIFLTFVQASRDLLAVDQQVANYFG